MRLVGFLRCRPLASDMPRVTGRCYCHISPLRGPKQVRFSLSFHFPEQIISLEYIFLGRVVLAREGSALFLGRKSSAGASWATQ
jgi:hypothetical protein